MGAAKGPGVRAEILLSLALVMLTANLLLAAFFLESHAAQLHRWQGWLGRALAEEARSPTFGLPSGAGDVAWWWVSSDGTVRSRTAGRPDELDAASLELAARAREQGEPLIRAGSPWSPVRFAMRAGDGRVAVAVLPPAVSRTMVLALVFADAAVFALFGAHLLRRRLVGPLRRVAAAAGEVRHGALGLQVPAEGVAEVADLARSFNDMSAALATRTGELEKAVERLRATNRDLRRARAGLDRAERLAAVGRLAAGVAHEVGNPMGALLAFLDLAGRDPGLGDTGRGYLERAGREGDRVRRILRQLLDFSRPPRARAEAVDLAAAAEEAAGLLRAQRRYADVDFEVAARPDTPPAWADPALVSQILVNLLLNAADAVLGGGGGRVRVAVAACALEQRSGDDDAGAAEGRLEPDGVECAVADDGPGVAPEDRERVFDPFFTTKPPGEGTGLGLANAQRLAEELGGALLLERDPELGGARFALRVPRAAGRGAEAIAVRRDAGGARPGA